MTAMTRRVGKRFNLMAHGKSPSAREDAEIFQVYDLSNQMDIEHGPRTGQIMKAAYKPHEP